MVTMTWSEEDLPPPITRVRVSFDVTTRRAGIAIILEMPAGGDAQAILNDYLDKHGNEGIGFRNLQENLDTTTSGGKLIFHIFGALAEFERELIRERTMASLAAARARGRNGGRPRKLSAKQVAIARQLLKDSQQQVTEVAKMLGVTRSTLYMALRSSSLNAWDGARILIRGTATQPVVMDAVEQTPGSWQGLSFSNAGKSELEHVEIRWAAGNPDGLYVGSPGAVHVYLSSLVMQQSIIHGSGSCAVSIANLHEGQTIDLQVEVQEHHSGKPELCSDV